MRETIRLLSVSRQFSVDLSEICQISGDRVDATEHLSTRKESRLASRVYLTVVLQCLRATFRARARFA
jgi:hypothetical protein